MRFDINILIFLTWFFTICASHPVVQSVPALTTGGLEKRDTSSDSTDTKSDSKGDSKSNSKSDTKTSEQTVTSTEATETSEKKKATSTSKSSKSSKSSATLTETQSDSTSSKSKAKSTVTSSSSSSATFSSISIDQRLPAGGITLLTPEATTSTYVKIGGLATFSWSYTSLSITPSALNIEAVCSYNSQAFTIATSHKAKETSFVWNTTETEATQSIDLLTSKYTLYIYDSDTNTSYVATAGRLAVFNYQIGLYKPQKYTPFPEDDKYVNMGNVLTSPTFKFLGAMTTIMVATMVHMALR